MMDLNNVSVWVKNIGDSDITLMEIGGYVLRPGEGVDLLDKSFPCHYDDYTAALRAIQELPGTVLYQGVHVDPPFLSYRVGVRDA